MAGLPTVYNVFRAFEDDDNSPVIQSPDRSRNVGIAVIEDSGSMEVLP